MGAEPFTAPQRREVIYCAGPFTATAQHSQAQNITRAVDQGAAVRALGLVPLVPHVAILGGCTWQDGQDECLELLSRADAVLLLEDWPLSRGALQEKALAEALGLPIFDGLTALKVAAEQGGPVTIHGRVRAFWLALEREAQREVRAGFQHPNQRPGLWTLSRGLWTVTVNPFDALAVDRATGKRIPPKTALAEYAGAPVGLIETTSATLRAGTDSEPSGADLLPGLLRALETEAHHA